MSQQLTESIQMMRAAVLTHLAIKRRMYVDQDHVRHLVEEQHDSEVWSGIVKLNKGIVGFCRRWFSRRKKNLGAGK